MLPELVHCDKKKVAAVICVVPSENVIPVLDVLIDPEETVNPLPTFKDPSISAPPETTRRLSGYIMVMVVVMTRFPFPVSDTATKSPLS